MTKTSCTNEMGHDYVAVGEKQNKVLKKHAYLNLKPTYKEIYKCSHCGKEITSPSYITPKYK
jgi:ribosomal protein L37AE/L43A